MNFNNFYNLLCIIAVCVWIIAGIHVAYNGYLVKVDRSEITVNQSTVNIPQMEVANFNQNRELKTK